MYVSVYRLISRSHHAKGSSVVFPGTAVPPSLHTEHALQSEHHYMEHIIQTKAIWNEWFSQVTWKMLPLKISAKTDAFVLLLRYQGIPTPPAFLSHMRPGVLESPEIHSLLMKMPRHPPRNCQDGVGGRLATRAVLLQCLRTWIATNSLTLTSPSVNQFKLCVQNRLNSVLVVFVFCACTATHNL